MEEGQIGEVGDLRRWDLGFWVFGELVIFVISISGYFFKSESGSAGEVSRLDDKIRG